MKTFWLNLSIPLLVFVLLLVVAFHNATQSGHYGADSPQQLSTQPATAHPLDSQRERG